MRKVYLEPNTEEEWGSVMDLEEGAPVQCWREASRDCYADQKRCHRGCAALHIGKADVICLAMPRAGILGELEDATSVGAEETGERAVRATRIVAAIENDLRDRRGLKHEWNAIDADVQDEIRMAWARIVRAELPAEEA